MNALRFSAAALVGLLIATGIACDARSAKPAPAASPAPAETLIAATPAATKPGAPAAFPAAEVDRARAAAAAGKLDVAADALADALRKVEAAGPLRVEALQVVADPVRGYGLYSPIPNNTIAPGQPLLLYFEPLGFGYRSVAGGAAYEIDMSADLRILAPDGRVLQEDEDMLTSSVTSRRQNREVQFVLRLQTQGMPEGDFIAEVTLHDRAGKKTAKASVPVKLRIP